MSTWEVDGHTFKSYADYLWWRSCGRKAAKSRPAAQREAIRLRHANPDSRVQAYQCRFCGEWHVGKPNESSQQ